jgi:hypothetical protein
VIELEHYGIHVTAVGAGMSLEVLEESHTVLGPDALVAGVNLRVVSLLVAAVIVRVAGAACPLSTVRRGGTAIEVRQGLELLAG